MPKKRVYLHAETVNADRDGLSQTSIILQA